MSSDSYSLFSLARNKLQSVVGGNVKDSASLHRWVLLKNSIIQSTPSLSCPFVPTKVVDEPVHKPVQNEEHEEAEHDSFMFPDPSVHLSRKEAEVSSAEDQWLDAVLEDLGDDDEVDVEVDEQLLVSFPSPEDDEPLSPLYSPMSSSDDLVEQSECCYSPEIAIPYPIPYPPLHPPLVPAWFHVEHDNSDASIESSPLFYHDPLPYFDTDVLEDLPVPDAIEDTSDDESDSPSTPFTNSTSSLSSTEADSSLLNQARTRYHSNPRIYNDSNDSYFCSFELDPLPFSDSPHSNNTHHAFRPLYPEC